MSESPSSQTLSTRFHTKNFIMMNPNAAIPSGKNKTPNPILPLITPIKNPIKNSPRKPNHMLGKTHL
jgi:hypothetical protein